MGVIRNQSIKNSISFYIGMAIGAVNTVLIYPNVFKDNPEHFGLIQILIAYAIVISTFTTLGVSKTFVKYFPTIKQKGQLYFLSFLIPLIGFVLAGISYFLFKEQIFILLNASELLKNNFFYIILLVFFIGFYDVLTSISRSFLNAATPIFINEVFLKFYSMSMLLLHWFDYLSFSNFLKIYLFGYVLKFAILYFIQWKNNRLELEMSLKDLKIKELLRFGIYVMAGGASIMIVTRLDMMMIGYLLDLEQVAFYTVAFFIGNAIKVPAKAIGSIATPLVAKAWDKQDIKEIQILYLKSSINQLIVGGIFFICVWINIDAIFSLLPAKFSHGKWVVFYIGLAQLFNITTGLNSVIIINSKFYRLDLVTNIILLLLTIAINYILIPVYGINGAAMATALSVFLFNLIRLILIKVKMGIQPFSLKTIYTILILLVVYGISIYLPLTGNLYLDIVWKTFVVLAIFIPLLLTFELSEDINKIAIDVRKRLEK
ncbi:MAG: oligosaccharide flippase family protein [Flavobacteriales bacterium]|nr:oligosaccharide flippase family protein [Flavobacteriales bacterium]